MEKLEQSGLKQTESAAEERLILGVGKHTGSSDKEQDPSQSAAEDLERQNPVPSLGLGISKSLMAFPP